MDDETKSRCSYEDYYKKYYASVLGYILKRIHDTSVAEDITMDVFLSGLEHFISFDPNRASFATWIYTIANNKIKNFYRDKKDNEDIDDHDICDESFENYMERAENIQSMRVHLANALNTLSEVQRKIVIYRYYYDYDSVIIAQKIQLTPVNVRVHLSRAIKKLKKYFEEKNIDWEM